MVNIKLTIFNIPNKKRQNGTKKYFLFEMVAYFSQDPKRLRATKANSDEITSQCYYRTDKGLQCAIGRYIPRENYRPSLEGWGVSDIMGNSTLPQEIESLGEKFLSQVQALHDSGLFWTDKGLSEEGYKHIISSSELNTITELELLKQFVR